jgi:hypothetical protein
MIAHVVVNPTTISVFTINFLTYQPGGLVPMEFLQVSPGINKSLVSRQFFPTFRSATEIDLNMTFVDRFII